MMDLDSSSGPLHRAQGLTSKVQIIWSTLWASVVGKSKSSERAHSDEERTDRSIAMAQPGQAGVAPSPTQDFKRLLQQHALFEMLAHTSVAFAPGRGVLVLRYCWSAFLFGTASINRLMQREADRLGFGQGTLSSATGYLLFLQTLVMP